jgi:hypothetical protein
MKDFARQLIESTISFTNKLTLLHILRQNPDLLKDLNNGLHGQNLVQRVEASMDSGEHRQPRRPDGKC